MSIYMTLLLRRHCAVDCMETRKKTKLEARLLSAPNHKSQIASDLKSRSPNRKNFPQIAVLGGSNRTFKSRDL